MIFLKLNYYDLFKVQQAQFFHFHCCALYLQILEISINGFIIRNVKICPQCNKLHFSTPTAAPYYYFVCSTRGQNSHLFLQKYGKLEIILHNLLCLTNFTLTMYPFAKTTNDYLNCISSICLFQALMDFVIYNSVEIKGKS